MARLDIVVADDDSVIFQILSYAGIKVRNLCLHIIEVVGSIVALQVVAVIDKDEVGVGLASFLDVGGNI